MPKRCALGCPPIGVSTHVFPHPKRFPETFKAWVEIIGGKLETPEDYKLYRKMKICDIHFTDKDKNRNNRLNCLAIPTMFLPGNCDEHVSTPSLDVAQPLLSEEIVIDLPQRHALAPIDLNIVQPSTSIQEFRDSPEKCTVSAPCEPIALDVKHSTSKENIPGSSEKHTFAVPSVTIALDAVQNSTSKQNVPNAGSVLLEHNYFKQEINNKRQPLILTTRKKNPSQRKHQQQIKNLKRQINKLRKQGRDFKSRLSNAEKIKDDIAFKRVTRNMSSPAKIFTKMQFSQTYKKPSGRRFSLEEKILSLSLFKRSAKSYTLLAKLFTLPSTKTLRSLLAQIKIKSGLVNIIFEKIKDTVQKMNLEDKLCILMFDEMSLSPQVHYDRVNDKLKGFTDFDNNQIADHVLVFMIKGVKANYKQPVAYYFTNSINKWILKNLIAEVIKKLQETGLTVLCTVCDQGAANVGAINELIQDSKTKYFRAGKAWRHDFFEVNKKQIIPLFDVPHMIKGLRNNLLNKNLIYTDYNDENKQKIVKWEYFQRVFEADKCLGELRCLYKLTEEHLNPDKIKKMRVKNAAQIFSHSVAVVTGHLSARNLVAEECRQIIPFVSMIDKLFDSLNSSTLYIPNGKIYKGCVRKNSPHHQLWQNAIKLLKTMKFIIGKKDNTNKIRFVESVTPTIKNFIRTLEGFQALWTVLSQKYSFDCMLTRHFNQDPLENFFGNIRSCGVRNVAPNCISFEGAYKSLLLNNFSSPHSIQANCEKDSYNCLQNLNFYLNEKNMNMHVSEVLDQDNDLINLSNDVFENNDESDVGQSNYVCGWVLTKCLTNVIKGCRTCKNELVTTECSNNNAYIRAKEYNKKKRWLVYPSTQCEKTFTEIQNITVSTLKKNVPKENLMKKIKDLTNVLVYFPCSCDVHYDKLRSLFEDTSIRVIVYSWCRGINRILSGKMAYDGDDENKVIAQIYYNKHKHCKIKK
ncbi:hypothetical protein evm_007040 [Chilo suppressalis]|nr:hypothetical protein evm_007040 [Chilo suppressalis]